VTWLHTVTGKRVRFQDRRSIQNSCLFLAPIVDDFVAFRLERVHPFVNAGRRLVGSGLAAAMIDPRDFEYIV